MNWIIASILMFIASAVMYVLIRKGQKQGVTTTLNSVAMFVLPVPLMLVYAWATHSSLILSPYHIFLLLISAFFLSWLGNLFSLKGIESSPNPGYSLIISKSYVVFTSLASVFLFASPLSTKSIIGIACIVLFSALIILADKKKSQKIVNSFNWVWLSLGAFFCWGGLALMSKYLSLQGVNVAARLLYLFVFVSIILSIELYVRKEKISLAKNNWLILGVIGVMSMLFNLFMQIGFQISPNPGYINAVNASSITLVAILSAHFFKDELNIKKMIGIVGVTVGLFFLFL